MEELRDRLLLAGLSPDIFLAFLRVPLKEVLKSILRVFVVRFSVSQFSSDPTHASAELSITAERPLHVFSQAAVANLPGVYLQTVRQSHVFR